MTVVLACGLAAGQKPAPPKGAATDKKEAENKPAAGQKPITPKGAPTDKKEAENKLVKAGEIRGEIIHIEPQKQTLRVKVSVQWVELNQGAAQALLQAQRDLANARDFNGRNDALRRIAQQQANLYQAKSSTQELTIEAAEDLVVRMTNPKVEFDDMGNLKKLTAKELAEKRGKDRLFEGEWSDLVNGMQVQVTLVREKKPLRPKGKDDIDLDANKLRTNRIVAANPPVPPK